MRSLKERLKGSVTKVGTYRCPKCNSKDIEQEFALSPFMLFGFTRVYRCHACDYRGLLVYNDMDGDLDDIPVGRD